MPFRYQKKNTIRSKINVPRFQSTRRKKKNSVNPSYGKKGDISGFHILIEKIDDEKDSTQYLNKMLCFGGIVPEIAHEINNPLTIISGQLQLLLSETKSSTPNYPRIRDFGGGNAEGS